MIIKVLGSGCSSCSSFYANVVEAVEDLNLDADVEFIDDVNKILAYEILQMPGLVLNEKVISSGKELTVNEIKALLSNR